MTGVLKQINRSNGGLPKLAVTGPAMLADDRLEGDRHRNNLVHGGAVQAVLMASAEYIEDLIARGFPLFYGALGENLTVAGLSPQAWRAGQRYRVGQDALIELTKLRKPCLNLDVYGPSIKAELYDLQCKAGDAASPRWAYGGFYARIIRPGLIQAGDFVALDSEVA